MYCAVFFTIFAIFRVQCLVIQCLFTVHNLTASPIQVMYCLAFIVGGQENENRNSDATLESESRNADTEALIRINSALVGEFNSVFDQILKQEGAFANGTYTVFLIMRSYQVCFV